MPAAVCGRSSGAWLTRSETSRSPTGQPVRPAGRRADAQTCGISWISTDAATPDLRGDRRGCGPSPRCGTRTAAHRRGTCGVHRRCPDHRAMAPPAVGPTVLAAGDRHVGPCERTDTGAVESVSSTCGLALDEADLAERGFETAFERGKPTIESRRCIVHPSLRAAHRPGTSRRGRSIHRRDRETFGVPGILHGPGLNSVGCRRRDVRCGVSFIGLAAGRDEEVAIRAAAPRQPGSTSERMPRSGRL